MAMVGPSDSIPLIVGGWRALTVICPSDLTAFGHYDNMSTITKIEHSQRGHIIVVATFGFKPRQMHHR